MVKKIKLFLIIVVMILFVYGIVLVSKPLAFEEKYKSERNVTSAPIELQFYECGIVKVNSTSQFYELQENTSGNRIIKISYDEFKVVNFYKLEYTRWDVDSQSDITIYLNCYSRLARVCVVFIVDGGLIIFLVCRAIKKRKNQELPQQNNN